MRGHIGTKGISRATGINTVASCCLARKAALQSKCSVHFQVYALGVSTWLLSRLNTYQLAHRYTVFGYDNGVALLNQRKQPTEASASLAASHDGKHWHCTSVLLALSGGAQFLPDLGSLRATLETEKIRSGANVVHESALLD